MSAGYNPTREKFFQNQTAAYLDCVLRDPAQCIGAVDLTCDFSVRRACRYLGRDLLDRRHPLRHHRRHQHSKSRRCSGCTTRATSPALPVLWLARRQFRTARAGPDAAGSRDRPDSGTDSVLPRAATAIHLVGGQSPRPSRTALTVPDGPCPRCCGALVRLHFRPGHHLSTS